MLASFEEIAKTRAGYSHARAACEALINEAGVATVPGHSFFQNPDDGKYLLRFCYAKEMPVLEKACKQLRDAFGG